jgi:hypothetical protein
LIDHFDGLPGGNNIAGDGSFHYSIFSSIREFILE